MKSLAQYEEDYRLHHPLGAKGKRIPTQRDYSIPWQAVEHVDESAMVYEEDQGVFWPLQVYLARNPSVKKEDVHKRLIKRTDMDGKDVVGLVLPSRHGCEIGCVRLTKRWSKRVRKIDEIDSTAREYQKGQVDARFKRVRAQMNEAAPIVVDDGDENRAEGALVGCLVKLPTPRKRRDGEDAHHANNTTTQPTNPRSRPAMYKHAINQTTPRQPRQRQREHLLTRQQPSHAPHNTRTPTTTNRPATKHANPSQDSSSEEIDYFVVSSFKMCKQEKKPKQSKRRAEEECSDEESEETTKPRREVSGQGVNRRMGAAAASSAEAFGVKQYREIVKSEGI